MLDVEKARKAVKKIKLPDWVESTRVEGMIDHTDEPALRVTIVVREGREDAVNDGALLNDVARRVHVAIDAAGVHLFPYTRFVGAREAA